MVLKTWHFSQQYFIRSSLSEKRTFSLSFSNLFFLCIIFHKKDYLLVFNVIHCYVMVLLEGLVSPGVKYRGLHHNGQLPDKLLILSHGVVDHKSVILPPRHSLQSSYSSEEKKPVPLNRHRNSAFKLIKSAVYIQDHKVFNLKFELDKVNITYIKSIYPGSTSSNRYYC